MTYNSEYARWYIMYDAWQNTQNKRHITHNPHEKYTWQKGHETCHMALAIWHMTHDTWHMTYDTWHMTHDRLIITPDTKHMIYATWRMTHDICHMTWHITPNKWHMTHDTWHMTHECQQIWLNSYNISYYLIVYYSLLSLKHYRCYGQNWHHCTVSSLTSVMFVTKQISAKHFLPLNR